MKATTLAIELKWLFNTFSSAISTFINFVRLKGVMQTKQAMTTMRRLRMAFELVLYDRALIGELGQVTLVLTCLMILQQLNMRMSPGMRKQRRKATTTQYTASSFCFCHCMAQIASQQSYSTHLRAGGTAEKTTPWNQAQAIMMQMCVGFILCM